MPNVQIQLGNTATVPLYSFNYVTYNANDNGWVIYNSANQIVASYLYSSGSWVDNSNGWGITLNQGNFVITVSSSAIHAPAATNYYATYYITAYGVTGQTNPVGELLTSHAFDIISNTVTYFAKSYGGFNYDDVNATLSTMQEELTGRQRISRPSNWAGAFSVGGITEIKKLLFDGIVIAQDEVSLRAKWDAFKAAHSPGPPRALYIDSDRYIMCEPLSLTEAKWNGLPYREFTLELIAPDPFWIGVVRSNKSLDLSNSNTITTSGTANTFPVITFDIATAPSQGFVNFEFSAGRNISFAPYGTLGTFIIDGENQIVTDSTGNIDYTAFLSGVWPILEPGSNNLVINSPNGVMLDSATISWANRWY